MNDSLRASLKTSEGVNVSVFRGRLMTPHELGRSVSNDWGMQDVAGYFLCGSVSKAMFEHICAGDSKTAVTATLLLPGMNSAHLLLTHQVAEFQHRFLLPLAEKRVGKFVASLQTSAAQFMLSQDGGVNSVVFSSVIEARIVNAAVHSVAASQETSRTILVKHFALLPQVMDPGLVPQRRGFPCVSDLSVSVIAPLETMERWAANEDNEASGDSESGFARTH